MSKLEKFVLDKKGVRELLKSAEIQQECMKYAYAAAGRCGEGYAVESRNYPERSGAAVRADTYKARKDNLKNNTLLKAVGV